MTLTHVPIVVLTILSICSPSMMAAEHSAPPAAILDHARQLMHLSIGSGQGTPEFWEGFAPGTEVEFRSGGSAVESTYRSITSYRIVQRDDEQLTLVVDSDGTTREMTPAPGKGVELSAIVRQDSVDHNLGRDLIAVDGIEYSCNVYERAIRSSPLCGTGEPDSSVIRIRAWYCPTVATQDGVLRILVSWEEDWGDGLRQKQTEELLVTNLHATRTIDGVDWPCFTVSIVGRRGDVTYREATQCRTNMVPGGALETIARTRDIDGTKPWRTNRHWIERLTVARVKP